MGEPDVKSLLARLTLPALLAWGAYYGIEPWDLPRVFIEGMGKRAGAAADPEAVIDRQLRGMLA